MTTVCERPPLEHLDGLACLIDAEYNEMPGMSLTFAQVKRLWNLSNEACGRVLDDLVRAGRLTRHGDRFCRSGIATGVEEPADLRRRPQ